jgi:hypothetical protein
MQGVEWRIAGSDQGESGVNSLQLPAVSLRKISFGFYSVWG